MRFYQKLWNKKIWPLIDKNFVFFLFLIVLISYGQMLWMQPWQDDNALFFKLAHIEEGVGYFGTGPVGSGITKYTPTPFIPIYYLFGTNTVPYFALLLVLYAVSAIFVYKAFSFILGKDGGRIAGFIFAAGYVSSDGIWRMANSVTTSISVITISLLLLFYWKFHQKRKSRYYFMALFAFFLATEFAINRTHYLFVTVVLFEVLFLAFQKPLLSIFFSIIRLLPFFYVFQNFALVASSNRTPQMKEFILGFAQGKFDLYSGFLGTVANLVIPDWLTRGYGQNLVAVLGGIILLGAAALFIFLKKQKRLFLLLSGWFLVNIIVYSAFNPNFQYTSVERYTMHSFMALTGIFGLLFVALPKSNFWGNFGKVIIILVGVGNLYNSVVYQHEILETRSFPVKQFYMDLKSHLPSLNMGDVLYFDVARDAQERYNDAVSTAQMPETASFAWRYGSLDRYDIELITDFDELLKIIDAKNVPLTNIHAFWYSGEKLVDTTSQLEAALSNTLQPELLVSGLPAVSQINLIDIDEGTYWSQPEIPIQVDKPVNSIAPVEFTLEISATPFNGIADYPLTYQNFSLSPVDKPFWENASSRQLALEYGRSREYIRKNSQISVSSQWQNNLAKNVIDGDLNTVWQSERTGWGSEYTFTEIKLPVVEEVNKIVWINGSAQNTPISYSIEVSVDGTTWNEVKMVQNGPRVDNVEPQVVIFAPVKAGYVRMIPTKTFNGDSPVISEFWVVPSAYSQLDITLAEKFLKEPLVFVPSIDAFRETLSGLDNQGKAQLVWQSNKRDDWQSVQQTEFNIYFDGKRREYKVIVPAGGTELSKLKLTHIKFPGNITLHSVKARYLKYDLY